MSQTKSTHPKLGEFTPDLSGTPADPENQYETPDALEDAMRKHGEWLEHKQRTEMPTWKDCRTSEPELATPNNTVLLKALMHTNNLIEKLDIKSIFRLLQNQIAKTSDSKELHVIIREKDQQIFQLQREIKESRIIGANKQYLRDEHSVSSEPQYRWEKPKHTVKPLMNPPTWEPVTTPNNFDILKLTDPPEGQPPGQPESEDDYFEIQKENIKLQRQVQYLQRRIAQSEKPKQQPESKQTDNSFPESPRGG